MQLPLRKEEGDCVAKPIPYSREYPYTYPNGEKTTLRSIGVLADALGRSSQTVRKWEIAGVIPKTPFKIYGARFYADEYLDAIVKSAEDAKLTGQGNNPTYHKNLFSRKCYDAFEELNKKYFKEVNK